MINILLPVHNRKSVTERLVYCLKKQTYQNYRLILIDDGSIDGTEEMVRNEIDSLVVLKGNGNWWWGGSLHQGYLWLRENKVPHSDFVLIMNDDTEFEDTFLEKGLEVYGMKTNLLIQAQCYSKKTGKLIDTGIHAEWKYMTFDVTDNIEEINCLSTRGLLFRVEDFMIIGGFFPRLLPHYTSDFEFTLRAYRKGMKLLTDPSFKLWVDEDTTGLFSLDHVKSFKKYLKYLLSIKCADNPIIFSSFIMIACPWRWKILNLYRLWRDAIWRCKQMLKSQEKTKRM